MRLNTGRLLRRDVTTYMAKTRRGRLWFPCATPLLALSVTLGLPVGAQARPDTAAFRFQPMLVVSEVTSATPGPTVALVAGVHGGKVAAIHALDVLRRELTGRLLRGRVLLVGPANMAGYLAGLAQISPHDSLNLNRVFPGRADGRPTEALAAKIMRDIVSRSDYLVDLHGSDGDEAVGRFAYAARPGVNPTVDSAARALAEAWGAPVIVWDDAGPRTVAESRFLQTAAHLSGVPAITVFESGATREDSGATAAFVRGSLATLRALGVLRADSGAGAGVGRQASATAAPARLFARRAVSTAPTAGRWEPAVAPGAAVAADELLGQFTSSTGERRPIRAAEAGLVLHQRKAGDVTAGTALIIAAVAPHPVPPPRP